MSSLIHSTSSLTPVATLQQSKVSIDMIPSDLIEHSLAFAAASSTKYVSKGWRILSCKKSVDGYMHHPRLSRVVSQFWPKDGIIAEENAQQYVEIDRLTRESIIDRALAVQIPVENENPEKIDLAILLNQVETREIGRLGNLQALNLSNNHLNNLPAEIGQLGNLQALNLSNNHLNNLPAEIGQLVNLQALTTS